jgi:hypothetical protein
MSMFRFTIRELVLVTGLIAVGCAGLKYANEVWWSVLWLGLLMLLLAAVVTALVGRGELRAAAIGFAVCVLAYAILFRAAPMHPNTGTTRELDPFDGSLPTTRLLLPVFRIMVKGAYIDQQTGKEVPDYDPTKNPAPGGMGFGGGMGGGMGGFGGSTVFYVESPRRENFMAVGHILWALALGYLGSRFAVWVDRSSRVADDRPGRSE